MPPAILGTGSADDLRDVVHRAVEALAEGLIVALPTETVYVAAASGVHAGAVERLTAGDAERPLLLVKSLDDARDYVPRFTPYGERLARRCWPGPVALVEDARDENSLLRQLPPRVQSRLTPEGAIGLWGPAHSFVRDVARILVGPIVCVDVCTAAGELPHDAAEAAGCDVDMVIDDGPTRFRQAATIVDVRDGVSVVRAGVASAQAIGRLASSMMLFVCTGNTCRSPMAEGLAKLALAKRLGCSVEQLEDQGCLVESAGVAASMGGRAAAEASATMQVYGYDLSGHVSQPLTPQLVQRADVIYTMTAAHREVVAAQYPEADSRIHLLRSDGRDVADPIGAPLDVYRQCAEQLKSAIEERFRTDPVP